MRQGVVPRTLRHQLLADVEVAQHEVERRRVVGVRQRALGEGTVIVVAFGVRVGHLLGRDRPGGRDHLGQQQGPEPDPPPAS